MVPKSPVYLDLALIESRKKGQSGQPYLVVQGVRTTTMVGIQTDRRHGQRSIAMETKPRSEKEDTQQWAQRKNTRAGERRG